MTTIERQFAFHVAGLRTEDLPQATLAATGRLFLDTAAAMLSGFANVECRAIVDRMIGTGTIGRCSVVGRPEGVDAAMAALANGIYAHWCEWDEVHDEAGIHGSAVIFPALLAAAEQAGPDGRTEASGAVAAAVVASYDVAARIGAALNAKSAHGWMTTGAAATIGAASGAARLLGLDAAGILSAMGIAATGGGLSRQPLADRVSGKNALCGIAAKNAIDAARMAAAGIVGAPNFFSGVFGINALYAGGQAMLEAGDLGRHFSILQAGVKAYPVCRSAHPSIDLMLDLLAERPGIGTMVETVAFTVPDLPLALCGRPFTPGENPRVSAQFSIPFTSALALTHGGITASDFLPERVLDFAAEKSGLIRNITVAGADPPIGAQKTVPCRARARLTTGEVIERVTRTIKGSTGRPMTPGEAEAKLRAAAEGVVDTGIVERLQQAGANPAGAWPMPALAILRHATGERAPV